MLSKSFISWVIHGFPRLLKNMRALEIINGNIITGDGETVLEKSSVIVRNERITEIVRTDFPPYAPVDRIINACDGYVIPGVVNLHAHGVTLGPFAGIFKPPFQLVVGIMNRHLIQGETTVLSVDGTNTVWECEAASNTHPLNVKTATIHTPSNIKLWESYSMGIKVLEKKHKEASAEDMIRLGAVAIGEVGAPGFPYGLHIQRRIPSLKNVDYGQAKAIKLALFGRVYSFDPLTFDEVRIKKILQEIELADAATMDEMKMVRDEIVDGYATMKKGLLEAGELAKRMNVPVISHHSPENTEPVHKLACQIGPLLVASHSNHLYEPEEAVEAARRLKKAGAHIDVYSGDSFGARKLLPSPETTFALLKEDLVDSCSTDYCGGYWDPILLVMEKAIEQRIISLPRAIAIASGAAKLVPLLAPNRGMITPGRIADIVIVDRDHISKVKTVIISGRIVVDDGKLVAPFRYDEVGFLSPTI